jgi:hypothetical protein
MKPISPVVKFGAVATLLLVIGVASWWYVYEKPRRKIMAQITAVRVDAARFEEALLDEFGAERSMREFAAKTLGGPQDVVDHRFRTLLTRVAGESGLERVVVDQGQPVAQRNPALSSLPSAVRSRVRSTPDFFVIRGSLRGEGGLEQVLRTLAQVREQTWVHRVEGFAIRPTPRNPDRFTLRVEVATAYAPDLVAKLDNEPSPSVTPGRIESEQAWRGVLAKNVFREPPPPPAPEAPSQPVVTVAAATPEQPPAPPPVVAPPYDEWRLTGIVKSSRGVEAMLVNSRSNERLTVLSGGAVLNAKLLEAGGERALFEIDGQKFEVMVGQTLGMRKMVQG